MIDPEIRSLVLTMLDETNPGVLFSACATLHQRLARLAELPDDSEESDDLRASTLASGTAISPRDAARCLRDSARTTTFMRGLRAAVADATRRFPGQTIEVLYAGCGPFATLALPLIVERDPIEVQLTLVDVHERSLDAARRLYERLDALAYIRRFVHADAAEYAVDADRPPHVVVSETMQQALVREPQVAITRRLAPQLVPGGILVPERVTVEACLADLSREFTLDAARPAERDRIALGTLLELSREARDPFRPVVVEIPAVAPRFHFHLLTTIQVYGDIVLREYDSGITSPLFIPVPTTARRIELSYHEGENPGWRHRPL